MALFLNSPKVTKLFGLLLLANCRKELSKIAQSGQTATNLKESIGVDL